MKEHRFVGIFAATIALLCIVGVASAATAPATTTANAGTTYTDGSALEAGAIIGYDVDCQFTPTGATASSACSFTPSSVAAVVAPGGPLNLSTTITYPANTGGKACFRFRVKTAAAVSAWGQLGSKSCNDLPALAPSAPGAATVTITIALTVTSSSPISVAMAAPVITR